VNCQSNSCWRRSEEEQKHISLEKGLRCRPPQCRYNWWYYRTQTHYLKSDEKDFPVISWRRENPAAVRDNNSVKWCSVFMAWLQTSKYPPLLSVAARCVSLERLLPLSSWLLSQQSRTAADWMLLRTLLEAQGLKVPGVLVVTGFLRSRRHIRRQSTCRVRSTYSGSHLPSFKHLVKKEMYWSNLSASWILYSRGTDWLEEWATRVERRLKPKL